jgi:hypothetical protein
MKEYQFKIQYRGIPSRGFEGAKENVIIKAEPPDGLSNIEFIDALQLAIKGIYSSATVTFQGATQ